MRTRRGKSGFTMAEMLIVTAIIAVLGGVIFIMVSRYQRSLAHLERDAVAKEIFVAAQNHLTVAESQGYLGISEAGFGTPDNSETGREVYYFDVNRGNRFTSDNSTVLDLMLPFASIDETVRAGGSYIIRYQADPAVVLDVFYCSASDTRFGHDLTGDYDSVLGLIDKNGSNHKSERRNYSGGSVLGWYGGEGTLETGAFLKTPQVEVFNEERLTVTVTDPNNGNSDASLKLIITGETSRAQAAVTLSSTTTNPRVEHDNVNKIYTVTLDDITTAGMHFADLNTDMVSMGIDRKGSFLPGENITVKAVAYSNAAFTNIAYSSEKTTNSLFADLREQGSGEEDASGASADAEGTTALIRNFRHLENLDDSLSGVNVTEGSSGDSQETGTLVINRAEQIADLSSTQDGGGLETGGSGEGGSEAGEAENTGNAGNAEEKKEDLSWPGFADAIRKAKNNNGKIHVYKLNDNTGTNDDCYCPVSPSYELTYEGKNHSISKVLVNDSSAAGLFGAPDKKLSVNGLVLVDFSITGTGSANAGALAGTLPEGSSVTNVLAYNSSDWEKNASVNIIAESGNAGGLIGSMSGSGSVTGSAAALYVKTSGAAGGLIGAAEGVTVKGSYSGGHTKEGVYTENTDKPVCVNVIGGTSAGGLIGSAAGTTSVSCSYATCSAMANTNANSAAGGLIGKVSGEGVSVSHSYAVGSVFGEGETGSFIGNGSLKDREAEEVKDIHALDFGNDDLILEEEDRQGAVPYDGTLKETFEGKYIYRTAAQLYEMAEESSSDEEDSEDMPVFLTRHYGDWQELKDNGGITVEIVNKEILYAIITDWEYVEGETNSNSYKIDEDTHILTGPVGNGIVTLKYECVDTKGEVYTYGSGAAGKELLYERALLPDITTENAPARISPNNYKNENYVDFGYETNQFCKAYTAKYYEDEEGKRFDKNAEGRTEKTKKVYFVLLDGITAEVEKNQNGHVADRFPLFYPGADIRITATVKHRGITSTSEPKTANSLFHNIELSDDGTTYTAYLSNGRHLQNLGGNSSNRVSGLTNTTDDNLHFSKIILTHDILWDGVDPDAGSGTSQGGGEGEETEGTLTSFWSNLPACVLKEAGKYNPADGDFAAWDTQVITHVDGRGTRQKAYFQSHYLNASDSGQYNMETFVFDGKGHRIINLTGTSLDTDINEDKGLFAQITSPEEATFRNLLLIDPSFNTQNGSAGALAGTAVNTTVTNVLARNVPANNAGTGVPAAAVTSGSGNAGGLIGTMNNCSVVKSAAALIVESGSGNAGGLAGESTGGTVSGCYSGGHTEKGKGAYSAETYNVTASGGSAGGLIGITTGTDISGSYSTCSAAGSTAGGLIGSGSSCEITGCYAVGLTAGSTAEGAFAGNYSGILSDCLYFEIINERKQGDTWSYLPALGNNPEAEGVTALDATPETYNAFTGNQDTWQDAVVYDTKLTEWYKGKYNLRTVAQLNTDESFSVTDTDYVSKHYGDWPAPEIFVINQ